MWFMAKLYKVGALGVGIRDTTINDTCVMYRNIKGANLKDVKERAPEIMAEEISEIGHTMLGVPSEPMFGLQKIISIEAVDA